MASPQKSRLVGTLIRQRREALGLSQRALGLLFNPPVTTQFISNMERGVTPLPPSHIPLLTKALQIPEQEILILLEKEYSLRLSGKIGKEEPPPGAPAPASNDPSLTDYEFMKTVCDAYCKADPETRQAFVTFCENLLKLTKQSGLK